MELAAIPLDGVGPGRDRKIREGYISLIFSVGIVIGQSKWKCCNAAGAGS